MSDLIDRRVAIEEFQMFRKYDSNRSNSEWVDRIEVVLKNQPIIDADPIIRCKDCKNWERTWTSHSPDYHYCPFIDYFTYESFYCAKAERRADETD